MGIATVLSAACPPTSRSGCWAGILLVAVRVVQGLAFGAEWGGAILMCFEHAPWRKKGLYTGITQAGFPVGLLLANFAFLISVPLGDQWAWRVPFLLSAVLIVVGILIRLKIEESPEFEELKEEGEISKNPLLEVLRDDWRNVLRAFCLRIAETAGYAVSVTFILSYLSSQKLADRATTLTALMIAAALGIVATTLWGALTDRIGRRPVYLLGTALTVVWGVPLFLVVNTGTAIAIILAFIVSYTDLPELARGRPGRLVLRAVRRQDPHHRRVAGLPALRRRLRLHPAHRHRAVRGRRLDRPGPAVLRLRPARPDRRARHPRDMGTGRARRGRRPRSRSRPARSPQLGSEQGKRMSTRIDDIQAAAYRIRRNALHMGEVQGQGYIGQALGVADVLAVAYTDQLRHKPEDPHWPDRDRFLLSIGHYAIALYAALAEAGTIPVEELSTYGSDGSRLPMSGMASYTPGMEISGGSLGHGLAVATGMALGLRHQGNPARVYNLLSDGELDEGSTWEAALQAAHHGLDNLTAIVDVNALQADGPTTGVLRTEPVTDKWRAFGWHALRVDGNDIPALVEGFDALREHRGSPGVLICDTRIGRGVPLLETREKAHFMRVAEDEWAIALNQLEESR